jgi:enamine deaminase RidA (YjgF/YER057c/UK114 family)
MTFALINPPGLYDAAKNGYSHLAILDPGVQVICISGQGGETEDGSLTADFTAQVRQAFKNLKIALAAAGVGPQHVAKLTVLIVDHTEAKLHIFGAELEQAFGTGPKPACTLIPVPRLALDGMLFEVEALAVLARGS